VKSHPVLKTIVHRSDNYSRPGHRTDSHKVSLVIEGGGMRGVVAGGMVTALEKLGLLNVFDSVFGSSAGGAAAAYFVAGQAGFGTSIFYENINNATFISIYRALVRKNIMNLDFLIDDVMQKLKPLDYQKIIDSKIMLNLVATDIDTGTPVILSDFSDKNAVFEAMRASARIPLLAGGPVMHEGRRLMDGGISAPIPVRLALASGATHILVFLTRPHTNTLRPPSVLSKNLIAPLMAKLLSPRLAELFLDRPRSYRDTISYIELASTATEKAPFIYFIRLPSSAAAIGRLEKQHDILYQGAADAIRAVTEEIPIQRSSEIDFKPYITALIANSI